VSKMPQQVLFTLCNQLEINRKLPSNIIKQLIQPVWPKSTPITNHHTMYIRVKVKRMLPQYRECNGSYDTFTRLMNDSDLLNGIDDDFDLDDDEAYDLAREAWYQISQQTDDSNDSLFSFIDYLKLIASRAKGFVYELASSVPEENTSKELIGVHWQTATMRANFEKFGMYISLEMMKRGINTLLWPYVAVAMYNEFRKICICVEGFLVGELRSMYLFISNFLDKYSPG